MDTQFPRVAHGSTSLAARALVAFAVWFGAGCAEGEVLPLPDRVHPNPDPMPDDDAPTPPDPEPAPDEDVPIAADDVVAPPALDVVLPRDVPVAPPPPRDSGVDVVSADPCSTTGTCATCTPRAGCGFCTNVGRCMTGTSVGPSSRACTTAQWAWLPSQCPPPPPDAGPPPPPPPPPADGGPTMCVGTTPTTGFCTSVGCNLQPLNFTACDSGAGYPYYGTEFCSSRATVIVLSAGWCSACMAEAPIIERDITRVYASRGVRVLTVLDQDPDRTPATTSFCLRWQSRYGLSSRMVTDPGEMFSRALRVTAYPFIAVVNRFGRVRLAQPVPSTSALRSAIESALAE